MKLKYTQMATLVSTGLFVSMAMAQLPASGAFTAEQEVRIGQVAVDYLVAHPEVLVQVSQVLQAKQEEQQIKAMTVAILKNQKALIQDKNTPSYGPAGAKVAVVEFFDYQCVVCARQAQVLEQVIKANPQVRFIFKEWPIFGQRWENSLMAAKTGLQIWQQKGEEAYLTYHHGLFATGHNEGKLTVDDISKVAASVQFDAEKVTDVNPIVGRINALAQQVGFKGTPGLVVMPTSGATTENITIIPGMVSAEYLHVAIKKAASATE